MSRSAGAALALLLTVGGTTGANAQTVVDGSDAAIRPETVRTVLVLIGRQLRDPEARIAGLRTGRAGALCGTVDVRNRMGAYTGPRGFVADIPEQFLGRLPEGPELLSPASPAAFTAMERARTLFAANCTED